MEVKVNRKKSKRLLYLMTSSSKFLTTRGWKYAEERSLEGYFDFVVSIHLPTQTDRLIQLDDSHIIVEIGTARFRLIRPKIFKKLLYNLYNYYSLESILFINNASSPKIISFLRTII